MNHHVITTLPACHTSHRSMMTDATTTHGCGALGTRCATTVLVVQGDGMRSTTSGCASSNASSCVLPTTSVAQVVRDDDGSSRRLTCTCSSTRPPPSDPDTVVHGGMSTQCMRTQRLHKQLHARRQELRQRMLQLRAKRIVAGCDLFHPAGVPGGQVAQAGDARGPQPAGRDLPDVGQLPSGQRRVVPQAEAHAP